MASSIRRRVALSSSGSTARTRPRYSRFPIVKADKPANHWNTFHIRMVGEQVTIKLNGPVEVWFEDLEVDGDAE